MNKILLLENKIDREGLHEIKSADINGLELILGDIECNRILNDFLDNHMILEQYTTIIIHQNIYEEEKRNLLFNKLKSYCKEKYLVIFSGGNNSISLRNDYLLELNSKNMYKNLFSYVEEFEKNNPQILILGYGKKWELNIFLNILEHINIFLENNKNENFFDFDEFEYEIDLEELKKTNYQYSEIVSIKKSLSKNEILNIRDKIYKIIIENSYE